jgi:allantoate deiminase
MTPLEQAGEVVRWCRRLATFSETPNGITRTCLSPPMREVHTALAEWMARLGMSVRVDAIGNIRGSYGRSDKRLLIGSHLDTVPDAGAFDGILGVVLGIALVEIHGDKLRDLGIEVIGFSDEEGVRFGTPFLGSRAVAGTFDLQLLDLRDSRGRSLAQAVRDFGLDPKRIPDATMAPGALGYLEFHIEQGPVLEEAGSPVGVVDAISGQTRASLIFTGVPAHAGTTPMTMRKDALAAGARFVSEVERRALASSGLVATVGKIEVEPAAGNVVPGACSLTLDVRHRDDSRRHAAFDEMMTAAGSIAAERGVTLSWERTLDQVSVPMSPGFTSLLERGVTDAGLPLHKLPSGAGHDAMVLAPQVPAAMLFLRCAGGISHNPAEDVREQDVAAALSVGIRFLDHLQRAPAAGPAQAGPHVAR